MKAKIIKVLSTVKRKGISNLILFLNRSNFFMSPCSVSHHLNIKGGLAQHSWNVYNLFKEKNKRYKLGLSDDTVKICALLHDVCKINFYKPVHSYFNKNAEWEYEDKFPLNHGHKSVIVLQRFIPLTDEECCIIAWHMSAFNTDLSNNYQSSAYYGAIEMYPACVALHTSDYEATTFLESKK